MFMGEVTHLKNREPLSCFMKSITPNPFSPRALHLCSVLLAVVSMQSCSFDIPPDVRVDEGGDLGMWPDTLPDVDLVDVDAAGDMKIDPVDMDMAVDANMDATVDMPDQDMDMTPPSDMSDMTVDMPDMMEDMGDTMPGARGSTCMDDADCLDASCEAYEGTGLCVVTCGEGSCEGEFSCSQGLCIPDDFCAADGVTGPGCKTCERCADVATCTEIIGGAGETVFQCMCPPGYRGDGVTCLDINECDNVNLCDANATCVNREGGYDCLCNQGFMGDGVTCQPTLSTCDMCSDVATCVTDAQGMEQCECDAGYVGNGVTCQDVDECVTPGAASCGVHEVCVNTEGAYSCACESGYVDQGGACVDIDECATNPCDALATCQNTEGGFVCSCPDGVAGDGLSCTPYASCAEIITAYPQSPSGNYWILTQNGTQLEVYCDMVSDNNAGYTLHRVDSTALKTTQQAYASTCAALGMEIVTPRSQEHMSSIMAWNGGEPPNIVNVFPVQDQEDDITNWEGRCSGQSCSFFINNRDNTFCRSTEQQSNGAYTTWSNNQLARDCYEYLEHSATPQTTGLFGIDPDGAAGPTPGFVALCGMNLDGGGWTLGATTSDDNQNTWTWNNRDLWTTNTADVGSVTSSYLDYKNKAIHTMPIKDLAFVHYPSMEWASYHDVSPTPQTISSLLSSSPAPQCDTSSGYPMTSGTIGSAGNLCTTDLYIHPGDYDGSGFLDTTRCENYTTFGVPRDESAWGFAWSQDKNSGCPFDDPAYSSFGHNLWEQDVEADGVGFGRALDLNEMPYGVGRNYMYLLMRGEKPHEPSGDNTTQQRLVLESTAQGSAGPQCPYGSWQDRGNEVVNQGWVICGINE